MAHKLNTSRTLNKANTNSHEIMTDDKISPSEQERMNARMFQALAADIIAEDRASARIKTLETLLKDGANLRAENENGFTLLHAAVNKQGIEEKTIEYLIDKKVDLNVGDKVGWTPLHIAAARSNLAITKILVEKGANVAKKASDGRTALHVAIDNPPKIGFDVEQIIEVYLENSQTDLTAGDEKGRTPADLARSRGRKDLAEKIELEIRRRQLQRSDEKVKLPVSVIERLNNLLEYDKTKITPVHEDSRVPLHGLNATIINRDHDRNR